MTSRADQEIIDWVVKARRNPRYMVINVPKKDVKDWRRQGWRGPIPYSTQNDGSMGMSGLD